MLFSLIYRADCMATLLDSTANCMLIFRFVSYIAYSPSSQPKLNSSEIWPNKGLYRPFHQRLDSIMRQQWTKNSHTRVPE